MRQISFILVFFTFFFSLSGLQAQKIGYMDLEAAIALMPETANANKALQTYNQKLTQNLQNKDNYLRTLVAEYQELAQVEGTTEADLKPKADKITQMQQELQAAQAKSQQDFQAKQAEMMGPILGKLETAMKEYAEANGYTYILNTSSNGTSIILHGTESDNITKAVLTKLGVKIPEAKQ
ncbi:MAG: OmpH family outer membrane protein [Bacteroidota bacterium]